MRYGQLSALSEDFFSVKKSPDGAISEPESSMISYHYSLEKMHKTRQPEFVKKWSVAFYLMMVMTVIYVCS